MTKDIQARDKSCSGLEPSSKRVGLACFDWATLLLMMLLSDGQAGRKEIDRSHIFFIGLWNTNLVRSRMSHSFGPLTPQLTKRTCFKILSASSQRISILREISELIWRVA